MIEKIRTIFSIPDLRSKVFYTLSILIVVRVAGQFGATYWPGKASQLQPVE